MKRTAYLVTVRRTVTGCDYTARLFLRSESDAFEAMSRLVRLAYGRDHARMLRLVSCTVAADQSRRTI